MPSEPREIPTHAEKQLELGTWGVFFVWMGIALMAGLDWGVWLLGVGVIVLGAQLVRRLTGLWPEGFWIAAGILFVLGGVSSLSPFGLDIALIPLLCVLAGVGLLVRALSQRMRPHQA